MDGVTSRGVAGGATGVVAAVTAPRQRCCWYSIWFRSSTSFAPARASAWALAAHAAVTSFLSNSTRAVQ
jgi:hypothetical protein